MFSKHSSRTYASKKDVTYFTYLEEFVIQSRGIQTICFNVGNPEERVRFQCHDKEAVKKFVTDVISFGKLLSEERTLNVSKHESEIDKCAEKIISKGRRYYSDEVQFSFVWVCYFIVKENRTGHLPVFKIYTNKNADEPILVDIFQYEYCNWDDFLENAPLPQSLLCIPENGVYNFNGNELALEYICFKGTTKYSAVSTLTPFSQQILLGIKEIQTYWIAVLKFLNKRKEMFMAFCKKYNITFDNFFKIIYVALILYQTIGPLWGFTKVCEPVVEVLKMFLSSRGIEVMEDKKLKDFTENLQKLLPDKNFINERQQHMIK